ncbi:MAG: efflux RND transporter periplasmic adaptor subunit [Bacteroidetes bacterium]|nr:MAG: efflux RND transporter periplasmic adaptor subunit [Bacteroidota bacterium]
MKNVLFFLSLTFFLAACGDSPATEQPLDLEGKKALLATKKSALRELEREIEQLSAEIEQLEPTKEKAHEPITAQIVQRTDFQHFTEIQGTVESDEYVHASAEVGGRILELPVEKGQAVQKGALVARLDLEQVRKQIAELETSLELAKDVFERQKRLWDQKIGSEIQFLQAKNNKERLEKSLETIRFQLSKANVYAPVSGIVEMVHVKSGEMTSPGAPIVTILDPRTVKVVANVPEIYLQSIKKGDKVALRFPALDLEKSARVSRIGNTINPANRTFEVEVELPNPDRILKPNLLAIMLLNDKTIADVPVIPLELVQQEVSGRNFVYIVEGEGDEAVARKVYVEIGDSYDGQIAILEGLKGGEKIVVEGARIISDNTPVKIKETN